MLANQFQLQGTGLSLYLYHWVALAYKHAALVSCTSLSGSSAAASVSSLLLKFMLHLVPACLLALAPATLLVGRGRGDITGPAQDVVFMGMANPKQKGAGIHMRLFARAFAFSDGGASPLMFVSIDAGMVGAVYKTRVLTKVNAELGAGTYSERTLCISGTHSHSGPSGFLEYTIFQFAGSGWVPATMAAMVNGTASAIVQAHRSLAPASAHVGVAPVVGAGINRSPTAFARNPPGERAAFGSRDYDEEMVQLSLLSESGASIGFVNWHATHGTSMNNTNTLISGDNKGYASLLSERQRNGPTSGDPPKDGGFVAAYASSALGDITPNTKGAFCRGGPRAGMACDARTSTCPDDHGTNKSQLCTSRGPAGDMFESTYAIGALQHAVASTLYDAAAATPPLAPRLAAVHAFVRMSHRPVHNTSGALLGSLCSPALGEAFAAGTIDGPGAFDFTQGKNSTSLFWRFIVDLIHKPTPQEAACQAPKQVLLPTGDISIPYPWAPSTVPLQLLQIDQLVIAAVPTELTTMAGRRVRQALTQRLQHAGALGPHGRVVVAGLANGYADYTVTFEEYQEQRYEGGSTIFGPFQLDGYIEQLLRLADALANGTVPESDAPPDDFSGRLLDTTPRLHTEAPPKGRAFGDVLEDAPKSVPRGSSVRVSFVGGSLRNSPSDFSTFFTVERQVETPKADGEGGGEGGEGEGGAAAPSWQVVAVDADPETRLYAQREQSHVRITVQWDVPRDATPGDYRIVHHGAWLKFHLLTKNVPTRYQGTSATFAVA